LRERRAAAERFLEPAGLGIGGLGLGPEGFCIGTESLGGIGPAGLCRGAGAV